MTILHAIILGVIQGLTEFIPVSSTAHMLIAQSILGIPANDAVFTFTVIVQVGTIISLVILYWQDLLAIMVDTLKNLGGLANFNSLPTNAKMGWYIIIATIPALVAGAALAKTIEALFGQPLTEASIRLFAAAILLSLAEYFGTRSRSLGSMTWLDALVIGLMQVISVFPGASRSGTTMSGAMFRGFDRPAAARFSFLLSVPVLLAASGYKSISLFKMGHLGQFLPLLLIGVVTAAIVGWLAIKWLLAYLGKHSLYNFAAYCAVVGAVCLFFQLFR
ncbi:MAG TPA: undecaprenyl-diphosphatase UppP [Anaerolineales bacterium]|jgi:undecaprenyl-diphosphatase